jgi:hypothetical protein
MSQHGRTMAHKTATDGELDSEAANECQRALKKLEQVVLEGIRHGFFDCTITCEMMQKGKRRFVIKAGVSHQFCISQDELDRAS